MLEMDAEICYDEVVSNVSTSWDAVAYPLNNLHPYLFFDANLPHPLRLTPASGQ
jgi:hypothetical protein